MGQIRTGDNLGGCPVDRVPGRGYVGPMVTVGMRVRFKCDYYEHRAGQEGSVVRNGIQLGKVRVLPDGAVHDGWVPLKLLQLLRTT